MVAELAKKKAWYEKLPNSFVLLFMIIVFVTILTYIIPAGLFDRVEKGGRMVVVPGTFKFTQQSPVGFFEMFQSITRGLVGAAIYLANIFTAGALMRVLYVTGAIENAVGVSINKLGVKNDRLVTFVMTIIFVLLGAFVGFENSIALVPIAGLIALAIGGDLMLGALIAIGGIAVGFAVCPIQPATVGTAHMIAELPLYSGADVRTVFMIVCGIVTAFHALSYLKRIRKNPDSSLAQDIDTDGMSLSKSLNEYRMSGLHWRVLLLFVFGIGMFVYGALYWKWGITEQVTSFIMLSIACGLVAGMGPSKIVDIMVDGAKAVTGGALIVGVARAIQVVLEEGRIADTIVNYLSMPLQFVPTMFSGILMTIVHSIINFFIPSGSGQAMATMPIMVPLSDLIGLTRQTAVFAFQVGDGVMNLVVPTLGGLLAMLALLRIPFDRWFRVAFPLAVKLVVISWFFIAWAVFSNWGPA